MIEDYIKDTLEDNGMTVEELIADTCEGLGVDVSEVKDALVMLENEGSIIGSYKGDTPYVELRA